MSSTVTIQQEVATLAIVHHANQLVITDGYAHPIVRVPSVCQTGLFCGVRETAIAILTI